MTSSYAYDSADRATTGASGSGSYVYDPFGRATSVPAADAPDPGRGGLSLGYFDDDLPGSITQDSVTGWAQLWRVDFQCRRRGWKC
ncbi:hypothetical protein BJY21_001350 [Kineosphaera limosa]|uniref:hypothetical protein n=1 Tax=Kineosphaera limosa TaxID=111564 RepID=UPI0012FC3B8B|nr:hypothetical protein [Kineosphaera limosa]NYE00166.1 hypothetical protein [Kineosphaera limosa]